MTYMGADHTRRILVIDDEPDIREVAQLSLELTSDWEVLTSDSGSAGIARAAAEQPDAILLDVMMPDMDGPTTLQALRDNAATRHIPVILLTGRAGMVHSPDLRTVGATGVIPKPFDALTLATQIATAAGWPR